MKISVIIPIYNVAPYLRKCVDSVLHQTFNDFELLLIDDGSTDESGAICDEYIPKDSRIKVIHKPNGGVSSARNRGIEEAQGDWFAFIDPDDWVDDNYLEVLYKGIKDKNVCLVCMGVTYAWMNPYRINICELIDRKSDNMTFLERMLCYESYGWGPVAKLYNKSKLGKIRYDETLRIAEDMVFNMEFLTSTKGIVVEIPCCCYYYFQREGSATKESTEKDLIARKIAFQKIYKKYPIVKNWMTVMNVKTQWWTLDHAYHSHTKVSQIGVTLDDLRLVKSKITFGTYITMRATLISSKLGYLVWITYKIIDKITH